MLFWVFSHSFGVVGSESVDENDSDECDDDDDDDGGSDDCDDDCDDCDDPNVTLPEEVLLMLRIVSADLQRAAVDTLRARSRWGGSTGGGSVTMDEEWLVTLTSLWNSTLRRYWV